MLVKPFSYLQQKVSAPTPGGIVTANLLHYYDGNNSSSYPGSGTTLYDLQGNTDMTIYGTTAWGTYGGITNVFNIPQSSNSYIGTVGSTGYDIANGISMEIWANFPSVSQSQDWFYGLFNSLNSANINRQMFRLETTLAGQTSGRSGGDHYDRYVNNSDTVTPWAQMSVNTWYHCVMTYSPGAFGYYLNSTSAGTPTNFTAPTTHFGTGQVLYLYLARRDDRINDNLGMRCSEWRFYNQALSQAEVTQNWDATKARYGY